MNMEEKNIKIADIPKVSASSRCHVDKTIIDDDVRTGLASCKTSKPLPPETVYDGISGIRAYVKTIKINP